MSILLTKLKNKQLEARKNRNKEETDLYTFLLGEIQRSAKKIESDEDISKLFTSYVAGQRKSISEKPYQGMEKALEVLTFIENEYTIKDTRKVFNQEETKAVIDSFETKDIKLVMPLLSAYEKEHNVKVDKAFANAYLRK